MGPARFHCATLLSIEIRLKQKGFVRSGIRTHAHRSGLRPERSALDLSAILTHAQHPEKSSPSEKLAPTSAGSLAQLVRASC